jgi:hypothetical protein
MAGIVLDMGIAETPFEKFYTDLDFGRIISTLTQKIINLENLATFS